jgi:polyisoprenoid-binding protein YceI
MTRLLTFNALTGVTLGVGLSLLFTVTARAAGPALQLDSARVTVSGTSNVHPYEASTTTVKVTRVEVSPAVGEGVAALTRPGAVTAFDIAIPAGTLSSPKDGLDKNMHKALKVPQFADITFSLIRLERAAAANAFRGVGTLTIAGVAREVALDMTIQTSGGALGVKGAVALLMTDYGITPPKAMLGMLKTDPKVTITFETVFSVPTT